MKKTAKILIGLLVGVAALLIIVVLVAFAFIDTAARTAVERGSAYALKVPTSLDSADVSVFGGRFDMAGLTVSNPEGYDTPYFLKMDDGGVSVDIGTLNQDVVELPTLTLTDLDVYLERKGGKANYKVILDNLARFESGETDPNDPETEPSGKQVVIQRVDIRNVRAHVRLLPIGGEMTEAEVVVPEIILENVGSGGSGATIGEVTNIVLKAIFASILATGENVLPEEMLGELQGSLNELASLAESGVDMAANLGEGLEEITGALNVGEVGEEAEKAVEGLGEAVGDLLGGKKEKDDGG